MRDSSKWRIMLTQNMVGDVSEIRREQTIFADPESVACEIALETGVPTKVVAWV